MYRILLIVGGILVGVLAALFIVPAFVDWNRYRGVFEEEATKLLGRDVRVSGRVNLRLLPTPYISFEKIRVADTQAGVGEPIFKADDFTVWLSVGPLFSGALEASELELKKPVITLVMDEKGSGNWSDLASAKPTSSFLPSSVALNAVRITDGSLKVLAPGGIERAHFEHINGELTAAALQGPYKIAAAFSSQGAARDIRLSTAAPEADGAVRFKGTVRTLDTGSSYTLDGRARDIVGQLKIDGELTARLPVPRGPAKSGEPAAKPGSPNEGDIEFKSAFKADTEGIELSDIALSFEQAGRPQLASGTARIAWRQRTDLDLTLTSKWLDLDKFGGDDGQSRPLHVLGGLARTYGGSLPVEGRTAIRIDLDQATLGGEVVSGLSAAIERTGSALTLKSLTASLPGNSRIEASGTLTPGAADALFDGPVVLRGAVLSRFIGWGARGTEIGTFGQDGSYIVTGRMRLGEKMFDGRGMTLQLGRHSLAGDASWSGGDARKIALSLEGTELDLTPFADRDARPLAVLRAVIDRLFAAPPTTAGPPTATGPIDIQAHVRFGRVLVGRTVLPDVAADLNYVNGNLTLPLLRIGLADEWQIELRGDIAGALKTGARGSLAGHIFAQTPERLEEVLALIEWPQALHPGPKRLGLVTPLRLAGRIGIGEKGPEAYEIQLDGRARTSRVAGTIRYEQRGAGWRDSTADVALTIDGSSAPQLLAQLLPEALQPSRETGDGAAGSATRVMLRAIGVPKDGLTAVASFDGAGLAAEWRGRLGVTDMAALTLAGDVRFTTSDLGKSVSAGGFRSRAAFAGLPVAGSLSVTHDGARWSLASNDFGLAGNRLAGKLDFDASGPATRVTGQISAAHASLPFALALLSAADPSNIPGAPSAVARTAWSSGTFDLSPLAPFDVAVTLAADRFELAPSIAVNKAALDISGRDGSVAVKLTRGTGLGGALTGDLALTRHPAGTRMIGAAKLEGGRLEAVSTQTPPRSHGRIDLALQLESIAHSPESLIGALKGTGEVRLAEARGAGLAPTAPRTVAEAITALKGELPPGEVMRQTESALGVGELLIGKRSVRVDVADSIAKLAPISVETTDARVTGVTVLDLAGLRVDSEWRIEPLPLPGERGERRPPLPGIVLVYTGALSRPQALDRRLQVDAFERELTVRKYERDVEELERIRRLDEERIRQEAERRRMEELQREQRPADPAARIAPEPQKQTSIDVPSTPRLPPLNLLALQPVTRPVLAPPPAVSEPIPAPSPSTATIPASADTVSRITNPAPPAPRRPAPSPRAAAPRADAFKDMSRNSP